MRSLCKPLPELYTSGHGTGLPGQNVNAARLLGHILWQLLGCRAYCPTCRLGCVTTCSSRQVTYIMLT